MMNAELNQLLEDATVIREANERFSSIESYQTQLVSRYRKYQFWYAPPDFDQWPEDMRQRPGKIHMTTNIIKPAVDVEARLQAKLPRIVLVPVDQTPPERARAELTEKLMLSFLESTGWETWMQTLCRTKSIYGKGVLKVFWNKEDQRPDVTVVENPANLRIGWGSSDFREMDWALYEYKLSPQQVKARWDVQVVPSKGNDPLVVLPAARASHSDPLNQIGSDPQPNYRPSDYENKQVLVWDYWYRDGKEVYNCIILQRREYVKWPTLHPELLDIPYIVVENDHEPGSPEGISTVGPLLDVQIEMNRAISHWSQLIADELTPAYQINDDSVPGGMLPKGGEILPAGDDREIKRIGGGVNSFPVDQLMQSYWFDFHRISGLPEIAFGNPGGSEVSGRALAVQIEGAANRIEPRRILLYGGLRELLIFWSAMVEKIDPKVDVGQGQMVGLALFVKGLRRWRLVAPEITPRDVIEHTQNTINKVNAGLMSAHSAMDELGIDSPEDELQLISSEYSSIALNPGRVQQQLAALATAQQLQLQAQQAQLAQQAQGASPGAALATANDQTGTNNVIAQQQQAQPTLFEDQNGIPTAAGGPPPGEGPQVQQTTLVRSNNAGQGQTLNQVAFNRRLGG